VQPAVEITQVKASDAITGINNLRGTRGSSLQGFGSALPKGMSRCIKPHKHPRNAQAGIRLAEANRRRP
jgi:hypothetical protein